jgi:hypothetical protein
MKKVFKPITAVAIAAIFLVANVNHANASKDVPAESLKVTATESFTSTVATAPGWYVLFGSGWVLIVPGK